MGLVLWIDQNTFATSLIEKVFKKKAMGLYSLDKAVDIAYLVEDIRPVVVVLDTQTAIRDLANFSKEYSESAVLQNTDFILLGGDPGLDFIKNNRGTLSKPLDPFKIPELLQKILGQLS